MAGAWLGARTKCFAVRVDADRWRASASRLARRGCVAAAGIARVLRAGFADRSESARAVGAASCAGWAGRAADDPGQTVTAARLRERCLAAGRSLADRRCLALAKCRAGRFA